MSKKNTSPPFPEALSSYIYLHLIGQSYCSGMWDSLLAEYTDTLNKAGICY